MSKLMKKTPRTISKGCKLVPIGRCTSFLDSHNSEIDMLVWFSVRHGNSQRKAQLAQSQPIHCIVPRTFHFLVKPQKKIRFLLSNGISPPADSLHSSTDFWFLAKARKKNHCSDDCGVLRATACWFVVIEKNNVGWLQQNRVNKVLALKRPIPFSILMFPRATV